LDGDLPELETIQELAAKTITINLQVALRLGELGTAFRPFISLTNPNLNRVIQLHYFVDEFSLSAGLHLNEIGQIIAACLWFLIKSGTQVL